MTTEQAPTPPRDDRLSRRDRHRQATLTEILGTGRRLLVESGPAGMSLRAIAREMGMTAPALYRYFPSHEALLSALTAEIYEDVTSVLEAARDSQPEGDVSRRLIAVSRAFRAWALEHREEFGLVFASPFSSVATVTDDACERAGRRFGMVFGGLFIELWHQRGYPYPSDEELDPRILEQVERLHPRVGDVLPPGAVYVFLRCWTRLYGTVALEVFGHCHWAVEDAAPLFDDVLRDCAEMLGLGDYLHEIPGLA